MFRRRSSSRSSTASCFGAIPVRIVRLRWATSETRCIYLKTTRKDWRKSSRLVAQEAFISIKCAGWGRLQSCAPTGTGNLATRHYCWRLTDSRRLWFVYLPLDVSFLTDASPKLSFFYITCTQQQKWPTVVAVATNKKATFRTNGKSVSTRKNISEANCNTVQFRFILNELVNFGSDCWIQLTQWRPHCALICKKYQDTQLSFVLNRCALRCRVQVERGITYRIHSFLCITAVARLTTQC